MDALALLSRLAASVPPPRQHVVVYAGVLASNSRWRPLVIPPPQADRSSTASDNGAATATAAPSGQPTVIAPPGDLGAAASDTGSAAETAAPSPDAHNRSGKRCHYIRWAQLMRLTFGLTVDLCPACGGRMRLRALVRDPGSIERFMRHQGLWSPPHEPAPARAPPYQRSVTRLTPSRQAELSFDT